MNQFLLHLNTAIEILASRLRELAYLNKGITLTLTDEREKDEIGNFMNKHIYSRKG